ncbi:MAG: phosphoenolpyruvate carboxykinase (ATP) [Firmicutes bacterium]|nr:phosphoenolpyruvate carboxykinase (ATP) [Bacillota bacterium]
MIEALLAERLNTTLRCAHAYTNLSAAQLVEHSLRRREAVLTKDGAVAAQTGKFTGRSPKDKYIVQDDYTTSRVHFGAVNQPMDAATFHRLYERAIHHIESASSAPYVFSGFAGAGQVRWPIRVITEYAWHSLFSHQLFIRPTPVEARQMTSDSLPDAWTIIDLPSVKANPVTDGTHSDTCIAISFTERTVLLLNTEYAGEIKKSVFTIINALCPEQGLLPMHCSANVEPGGSNPALFFGLSGTGKTTLSADPSRRLIGDDEHIWERDGIANVEGGCYAKCLHLTREHEPQIWSAIRFGTVLENVDVDPDTREVDFASARLTENTRAAYPIEYIEGAVIPGIAGHPRTIIFLTADASGVLPPIARLSKAQAMYHYLAGYTSKLAGTERGVTNPEATFSACFGAPFLPLHPTIYAKLLGDLLDRYDARVYLVNTGWTGGPYGVGQRMPLAITRQLVQAALSGNLGAALDWEHEPVFGLAVPKAGTHFTEHFPEIPTQLLTPRLTWADPEAYDVAARALVERFRAAMQTYAGYNAFDAIVQDGGPLL